MNTLEKKKCRNDRYFKNWFFGGKKKHIKEGNFLKSNEEKE